MPRTPILGDGRAEVPLVKVLLSCVWLFVGPMDCSLPGSSVHRILQVRILEWIAIPFSGDLPNLGIKPGSPAGRQAGRFFFPSEPCYNFIHAWCWHPRWFIAVFNSLYHLASGYSGLVIKILHYYILYITVLYKCTKAKPVVEGAHRNSVHDWTYRRTFVSKFTTWRGLTVSVREPRPAASPDSEFQNIQCAGRGAAVPPRGVAVTLMVQP